MGTRTIQFSSEIVVYRPETRIVNLTNWKRVINPNKPTNTSKKVDLFVSLVWASFSLSRFKNSDISICDKDDSFQLTMFPLLFSEFLFPVLFLPFLDCADLEDASVVVIVAPPVTSFLFPYAFYASPLSSVFYPLLPVIVRRSNIFRNCCSEREIIWRLLIFFLKIDFW